MKFNDNVDLDINIRTKAPLFRMNFHMAFKGKAQLAGQNFVMIVIVLAIRISRATLT